MSRSAAFAWNRNASCLALLTALLTALVAGCAKPPPPPPPPPPTLLQAVLEARADVNPDSRGRPSPIVVRVLELKTLAAFNSADFFSLWDREKETLGPDLVAREEYQMRPGDSRKFERVVAAETRFVVAVAAYRDIEHATWRDSFAIVQNKTQSVVIGCDALKLAISRK